MLIHFNSRSFVFTWDAQNAWSKIPGCLLPLHWKEQSLAILGNEQRLPSGRQNKEWECWNVMPQNKKNDFNYTSMSNWGNYQIFACAPLRTGGLPAGRWSCHSAAWSSPSLSGQPLSGHWSQTLCRTSACPTTTETTAESYFQHERTQSFQVCVYVCTWQKRWPSFSCCRRLDRWQLTTKWESSRTVLNQRRVGSRA